MTMVSAAILLFVAALKAVPAARRVRVVARELLIAYAVMVVFLFTGEHLLHALSISGPALTSAGGIVPFLIALRMVFPSADHSMAEPVGGEPQRWPEGLRAALHSP
jgi:multiple antibiotic resistance protein